MGEYVYGTFVSQKINKIRWRPEESNPNSFISGSWDDTKNCIKLWKFSENDGGEFDFTPKNLSSVTVYDDVTQLKFLNKYSFMASTSAGILELYTINEDLDSKISRVRKWDHVHQFNTKEECACTDFACHGDNIVSVGEDGKIHFIDVNDPQPLHSINEADSCIIRCVSYYAENEVVTGNCRGQIKIWNIRSYSNTPETTFMLSGTQVGCNRIIHHPSQKHIILAGLENGSIAVWDLRNTSYLITLLDAHTKSVDELAFYPDRPEHLFSCSASGQLWHWDTTKAVQQQLSHFRSSNDNVDITSTTCPWMSEDIKNKVTVTSLIQNFPFPINTFDIRKDTLICGCDNEAVYLIKNLSI